VKRAIGADHVHVERARMPAEAIEYCKKAESRAPGEEPVEEGDPGGQGKRKDIDMVTDLVRAGASLKRVAEDHPGTYIKFHKGITALRLALHPPVARNDIKVFTLTGRAGCGKTRFVHDNYGPDVRYNVFDMKAPWFDGYDGKPVMLLDEMGPDQMGLGFLKKLLDRYDLTLPIKGGSVAMAATTIFITSNYVVADWYPRAGPEDFAALARRMTCIDCDVAGWEVRLRALCGLPDPLLAAVVDVPPPAVAAPMSPVATLAWPMTDDDEDMFAL